MANLSNILAAIGAFFIGAVLVFVFNSSMMSLIDGISDSGLKLLAIVGWFGLVILIMLYFPIHMLTSEEKTGLS